MHNESIGDHPQPRNPRRSPPSHGAHDRLPQRSSQQQQKSPMNKSLLALAFTSAGLLAVPAAFAQSAPTHTDGWFVNGNVGRTSIDKGPYDDHDTGYAVGGGYRWSVDPFVAIGVEAGYN